MAYNAFPLVAYVIPAAKRVHLYQEERRPMTRYVQKTRRIYHDSHCRLCGFCHGVVRPEIEHRPATCLACGTRQCIGNGLGRGTCGICLVGFLEGWSGSQAGQACSYKGCTEPAVACGGRGKARVCFKHIEQQRPGFLAEALAARASNWVEVEESPRTPYAAA